MPLLNYNEDEARVVLSEAVLELLECQLLEEEEESCADDDTDESGMAMVGFRMECKEKNHRDIGDEEGGTSISPVRRTMSTQIIVCI